MASKSTEIDWDEVLLTQDPKKKEIAVSFKRVDGGGFFSTENGGGGNEPGTPPGAREDENGCTNTVELVSNDTFNYQSSYPHWVWLVFGGMPIEYMEVDIVFTDGTNMTFEGDAYTSQAITLEINPATFESDGSGLVGKKVPLLTGDLSDEIADGATGGNYNAEIVAVRGFSTGDNTPCFTPEPVTIEFGTEAISDPIPNPDGGPVPGNNPECVPHDCLSYTDWVALGKEREIATHWRADPPTGFTDMWGPDISNGQTDSRGQVITTIRKFKHEDGTFAQVDYVNNLSDFNDIANIRSFDASNTGKGPCAKTGTLKARVFRCETPMWDLCSAETQANCFYPKGSLNLDYTNDPSFDKYDNIWNAENYPDGGGFEMELRTVAAVLIWPYKRDGTMIDGINFTLNHVSNNDLQTIFNSNNAFASWATGANAQFFFGPSGGITWGTIVPPADEVYVSELQNANQNGISWIGLDATCRTTIDYDTPTNRYQLRKQGTIVAFNEFGDTGARYEFDDASGYIYNEIFRIFGEQHNASAVLDRTLFTSADEEDYGTLATYIKSGSGSRGATTNQIVRPYEEMKAIKRSMQDYVTPPYCQRIP